jgi:uncharacterized protein YcbX
MSDSRENVIGSVVSVWRYPVKSMLGEELETADVAGRGLVGDRAYALIDRETGKVASAKNPRKWGRLFECRAAFSRPPRPGEELPPVNITLPDGTAVASTQSDIDEVLSRVFEREVSLATTAGGPLQLEEYWPDIDGLSHRNTTTDEQIAMGAAGTFFDFAATHVMATATLERLHELYPQGEFAVERFRPNLVVQLASGERAFTEAAWTGWTLEAGAQVRLNVLMPCARCVMTTLPQGGLPNDPGILRTVALHNKPVIKEYGQALPSAGVYASVQQGGTVRRGDPVSRAQHLAGARAM